MSFTKLSRLSLAMLLVSASSLSYADPVDCSGCVDSADIASNAVNATHLQANSVSASALQANAVTSQKILAGAVNKTHLAAGQVVTSANGLTDDINVVGENQVVVTTDAAGNRIVIGLDSQFTDQVNQNQTDITSLVDSVAINQTNISGLSTQVTQNQTDISTLNGAVNQNQVDVSDLLATITQLQQRIVDLEQQQEADLNFGLVSYYPFSGNTNDESGNNHHGTSFGASLDVDRNGNLNSAYYFNGNEAYIEVADSDKFTLGTNYTFAAWIKTTNVIGEIFSNFQVNSPFTGFLFGVGFNVADGRMAAYMANPTGGTPIRDTGAAVNDGNWHYVVATADGTHVRFYLDGTLTSSTAITRAIGNSSNTLKIGIDSNPSTSRDFNGHIDEVRIYDRALSAVEINRLYNQ